LGFSLGKSFCQVKEHFIDSLHQNYVIELSHLLRLEGGYEELIGIDSAYVLSILTGGMVLRFNPTYLNDREPILHYLNHSKSKNFIVGVIGSELVKVFYLNNQKLRFYI